MSNTEILGEPLIEGVVMPDETEKLSPRGGNLPNNTFCFLPTSLQQTKRTLNWKLSMTVLHKQGRDSEALQINLCAYTAGTLD